MTVSELYKELDRLLPTSLSCDWDNDGLMCCPDGAREVRNVLLTLDVTGGAVERAINGGFDVIISHHPMIFKPIKSVVCRKITALVKANISVMSFHTRLDAAKGGVNDVLAERLGIRNTEGFTDENIGVIGELDREVTLTELISRVKTGLSCPYVEVLDSGIPCKKIAVCGGDGKDFVTDAAEHGADTYITGAMSYNSMTDAEGLSLNIISAGHYYTENPVLSSLEYKLSLIIPKVRCEIYNCNVIEIR